MTESDVTAVLRELEKVVGGTPEDLNEFMGGRVVGDVAVGAAAAIEKLRVRLHRATLADATAARRESQRAARRRAWNAQRDGGLKLGGGRQ